MNNIAALTASQDGQNRQNTRLSFRGARSYVCKCQLSIAYRDQLVFWSSKILKTIELEHYMDSKCFLLMTLVKLFGQS